MVGTVHFPSALGMWDDDVLRAQAQPLNPKPSRL